MKFHGKNAKGIVWEHNTHIGDARATDMKRAGMVISANWQEKLMAKMMLILSVLAHIKEVLSQVKNGERPCRKWNARGETWQHRSRA
jgi:hypothetical protein